MAEKVETSPVKLAAAIRSKLPGATMPDASAMSDPEMVASPVTEIPEVPVPFTPMVRVAPLAMVKAEALRREPLPTVTLFSAIDRDIICGQAGGRTAEADAVPRSRRLPQDEACRRDGAAIGDGEAVAIAAPAHHEGVGTVERATRARDGEGVVVGPSLVADHQVFGGDDSAVVHAHLVSGIPVAGIDRSAGGEAGARRDGHAVGACGKAVGLVAEVEIEGACGGAVRKAEAVAAARPAHNDRRGAVERAARAIHGNGVAISPGAASDEGAVRHDVATASDGERIVAAGPTYGEISAGIVPCATDGDRVAVRGGLLADHAEACAGKDRAGLHGEPLIGLSLPHGDGSVRYIGIDDRSFARIHDKGQHAREQGILDDEAEQPAPEDEPAVQPGVQTGVGEAAQIARESVAARITP